MKFLICGNLDAPDWILKEIEVLSKMSAIKFKLLCAEIVKILSGDLEFDVCCWLFLLAAVLSFLVCKNGKILLWLRYAVVLSLQVVFIVAHLRRVLSEGDCGCRDLHAAKRRQVQRQARHRLPGAPAARIAKAYAQFLSLFRFFPFIFYLCSHLSFVSSLFTE
jgi:hypothetical protein